MPFIYFKTSVVSGNSLNTGFSQVYGPINQNGYHLVAYNTTSSTVGLAIATSAPTATITDQCFVPSSFGVGYDANPGENLFTSGMYVYARVDDTAVQSGSVRVVLK